MTVPHLINLIAHVAAGACAMGIGFCILFTTKGTVVHRKMGRAFTYFTLAVCLSAVIGSVFFRFIPMFAVLTVLVAFQLLSGWHVIYTKDLGPNRVDLLLASCATLVGGLLLKQVLSSPSTGSTSNVVVYSSLGTLALLVFYEFLRWTFPKAWHANLWRYEHIYKLVASLFAMISAFVGNVIRFGQPYSQIAPSIVGLLTIGWFFWMNYRYRMKPSLTAAEAIENPTVTYLPQASQNPIKSSVL